MAAFREPDSLEELVGARCGSVHSLELEGNLNVLARSQCRDELKALKNEPDPLAAQLRALVFVERRDVDGVVEDLPPARRVQVDESHWTRPAHLSHLSHRS